MITDVTTEKAAVLKRWPFVFLGDNAMRPNMKFVSSLEKEYNSKIDFHSADPDDRAELRRLANRQVRRRINQDLKSHLQDFLD
jgi:hypothetical protein